MLPLRFLLNLFVFSTLVTLGVARLVWEGLGGLGTAASEQLEVPALLRLRVSTVSLRSRPAFEDLEGAAYEEKV